MFRLAGLGVSDIGKKRQNNEDCLLIDDVLELYAVFDGMGGHQGGEVAASLASAVVRNHVENMMLESLAMPVDYGEILRAAFLRAHISILKTARKSPTLWGMGTTATAMWRNQSQMIFCHIGDSRAYLFRNGQNSLLTEDHTLANEMIMEGHVFENRDAFHNFNRILTQVLGASRNRISPTIFAFEIEKGDRFLLCTDGVSRYLDDSLESHILNADMVGKDLATWFVEFANSQGGNDNATAVVVEIR